ncbi:hypothetical protein DFH09DRAFT_1362670 [Mycena vulgaris]|nr:hypothetical protein DFH09DRAFT_1362670 [Mycena vulgaris]
MPARRKATLEEQLQVAQDQLRATEKKLKDALAAQAVKPKKLMPRPKGQAGKGSGYNLQREMGLARDKPRYNCLMHIVRYLTNRFLNTGKTIKDQEKTRLEKTIKHIQKEFPFFQRFQGGWPIRDLIKQYLANNTDKYKRSVRQEQAAAAVDTADWTIPKDNDDDADSDEVGSDGADSDSDEPTQLDDNDDNNHANADARNEEQEEQDENEDSFGNNTDFGEALENEMDVDSFDGEKIQKENIAPSSEASPVKKPTPRPKLRIKSATITSPKKRKIPESRTEESPRPVKRNKLLQADIPDHCPSKYCKDRVPDDLPSAIFALFTRKHNLIAQEGPSAVGCRELTRDICLAIRQELERTQLIKKAKDQGWPQVDFDNLPDRIFSLLLELHALQDDSHFLEESPVWNKFLELIGYQVFAFCRSLAKFKAANLGCGYFGPKGYNTIRNVLNAIGRDDEDDEIDHELFATISPLVDKPQQWDEFEETSNLISPERFTKFILIPHVAMALISADLEIGLEDALGVLDDSRRYGDLMNANKPEETVDVVDTPKKKKTQPPKDVPPRHRKVTMRLPEQKVITLDNFPPPAPKHKKQGRDKDDIPKSKKKQSTEGKTLSKSYEKQTIPKTETKTPKKENHENPDP